MAAEGAAGRRSTGGIRGFARHRAIDKPRERAYKLTLDRGLQLRIAPDGARTLLVRYTVKGSEVERQYRLLQECGEGPGQMKLAAAGAEAARIRALARDGVDWPAQDEARLRAEVVAKEFASRHDGLTVEKALREYVAKKRRAKDGLPLKARTKADYLGMIEAGNVSATGSARDEFCGKTVIPPPATCV